MSSAYRSNEIPGGRDPNIAARTSDSARPTATVGQSGLLRRSRSPASRTPTDHRAGGGVNRDASLSCRAPGSDVPAQHGRAVHGGWFGSAIRQHANCDAGPVAHNRRGNRFAHGRSSCRSAPGTGIPRTHTAGLTPRRHRRIGRHHVDERHYCRDTRPACVPGTVWGTAPSVTAKFRSAPCLPLVQGNLDPPSIAAPAQPFRPASRGHTTPPTHHASRGRGDTPLALHVARFERV